MSYRSEMPMSLLKASVIVVLASASLIFDGSCALAKEKNFTEAITSLRAYLSVKDLPKARASALEALALAPMPEVKSGIEMVLGQIDLLEGKSDQARERWRNLAKNPNVEPLIRVDAQLGTGELLLNKKRYDEALEVTGKAFDFERIRPSDRARILTSRSGIFAEQKKYGEAREELFKIFDLEDVEGMHIHRWAWMDIGRVYEKEQKYDEARAAWDKVLQEEEPADARSQAELRLDREQAQLLIAKSYLSQKNHARAREEYQKVLAIEKVSGQSLNEANKQLEAIDEAEKAPAPAETAPK